MITIPKGAPGIPKKAKPKAFLSLGIDLSINATGLVLLDGRDEGPHAIFEQEIKMTGEGIAKKHAIVEQIIGEIESWEPDRIVVEGYSLGKNMNSTIPLVEVGALLRYALYASGRRWMDPNAPQLKKFATGKGNSPKDVVMMHVLKRWGHESKTNNTADAYVLACMGLAHANRLKGVTLDQRTIVGNVKLNSV